MVVSYLVVASVAHAHGVGLSRGEYAVKNREVTSRLVLARHEAALLVAEPAPDAVVGLALAQRTRVSMGGKPCPVALESVQLTEADGLELRLRHTCPRGGDVTWNFEFVGALDPGHRHVAEIRFPDQAVATFVAYKGNAATSSQAGGETAEDPPRSLGFLWMGVEHILTGWDHLLFLLGVSLLPFRLRAGEGRDSRRARLRTLALSVTAFTVAHSITLTLGVLRVAPLAPTWVEPLIALSIAAVGLEALFLKHTAAPYVTTFGFGLVHGMGFAGALVELELAHHELPAALALFNLGVELGQLTALIPVVVAFGFAARAPRLLSRLVPATGIALTLAGVTLFGARIYESLPESRAGSAPAAAPVSAPVAASLPATHTRR